MGIKVCPERNRHGEPPSFATLNQTCLKPTRPNRVTPSGTWYKTGLSVRCELDTNSYPKGIAVSDDEMAAINIRRDEFHGEWNYTIRPHSQSGEAPNS